jgi:hypothetical protein
MSFKFFGVTALINKISFILKRCDYLITRKDNEILITYYESGKLKLDHK